MSQVALRLPDSLHQYAKQLAANDDASLNQFIVMAVAEKVSAFKTEAFFQQRAALSNREKAATCCG
jgi:HicB family